MSGIMMLNAGETGQPRIIPLAIADISAGIFASLGILAALAARGKSGRGQVVDLSLIESMLSMMPMQTALFFATGDSPPRFGTPGIGNAAPYQVFTTRNGWIAIAAAAQPLWESLCRVLECEHLMADPRFASNASRIGHSRALSEELNQRLAAQDTEHWLQRLDDARVPASPVLSLAQILSHDHLQMRGSIWRAPAGQAGNHRGAMLAPMRLSETPVRLQSPAPRLGEHTEAVLTALGSEPVWPARSAAGS